MIDPDIRIINVDPTHWKNLLGLFAPAAEGKGALLIFLDGEECVKAIHTRTGPILGFAWTEDSDATELCKQYGADRIGLVPADLPDRAFTAWQNAVARDDDWDAQIILIIEAIRPLVRDEIEWRPAPPPEWPRVPLKKIERRLARFWPDKTCVGLFIFDGRTPFASMILGKSNGKISLFTTLDALGLASGPLDWRTQREMIERLCAERLFPLRAALWIENGTWREMAAGPRPLTFLRAAMRRGRAALSPAPLLLRVALFFASRIGGK